MYPPIWGSYYWKVIHFSCLSYPFTPTEIDKSNMTKFITSICQLLPCPQCRYHALRYIQINKPKLANRVSLLYWSFDFHNEVNQRTGKTELDYVSCLDSLINVNVDEVVTTEMKRAEDHQSLNEMKLKLKKKTLIIYTLCGTIIILTALSIVNILIKRKNKIIRI